MDITGPPEVIVVAGGMPPTVEISRPAGAFVIAADRGVVLAEQLGLSIDVALGDWDSTPPDVLDRLHDLAPDVREHTADKDATDLELALDAALDRSPARVLVLGIEGGRPDHALANLLVASAPRFAALDIELVLDHGHAWAVHDRLVGRRPAGETVSVLPVHGGATVSIAGVRWPLDRARLDAGTTWGVSNETTGGPLSLTVHDGTAYLIIPRPQETPA